MHWAAFDNAVYVMSFESDDPAPHVERYDPNTHQFTETKLNGIWFSPSGKYYYRPELDEGGPAGVYETATDRSLGVEWSDMKQLFPDVVGWLPHDDTLVAVSAFDEKSGKRLATARTILLDVGARKMIDVGDRGYVGFKDDRLVFYRNGTIDKRRKEEIGSAINFKVP